MAPAPIQEPLSPEALKQKLKPDHFNIKSYAFKAKIDGKEINDERLALHIDALLAYPDQFHDFISSKDLKTENLPKGVAEKSKAHEAILEARHKYITALVKHIEEREALLDAAFPMLESKLEPRMKAAFDHPDLRGLDLEKRNFSGTVFDWDVSDRPLPEELRRAERNSLGERSFAGSNLKNATFKLQNTDSFEFNFEDADLSGAQFKGGGKKGTRFYGNFSNANLSNARFSNISFDGGISFENAELQNADFRDTGNKIDKNDNLTFLHFDGAKHLNTIKVNEKTSFRGAIGIPAKVIEEIGKKNGMPKKWIDAQIKEVEDAAKREKEIGDDMAPPAPTGKADHLKKLLPGDMALAGVTLAETHDRPHAAPYKMQKRSKEPTAA